MQENNELQMNMEEQADFKKQPKNSKAVSNIYDIVSVVVSAVAVIAIVFTFVTRVLVVSGASMNPTLNNGDTVAISSLKRSFDYGDIVIVAQPNAMHKTLIKRVIAVGGQTVDIDSEKGIVYVDGKALDENILSSDIFPRQYRISRNRARGDALCHGRQQKRLDGQPHESCRIYRREIHHGQGRRQDHAARSVGCLL